MFAIPFGIAGLSGTWRISGQYWTSVVGDVLAAISAVLALALAIPWVARLLRHEADLFKQLRDPVLGPSVPELAITAMLLSATLLIWANTLGVALVMVFAVLTLASGLAVVTAWFVARLPLQKYQPGFYLPTAGVSLLAAQCVFAIGWIGFAQVLFFIGVASWLILAVVTSVRLARAPLPPALRPVLAIQIAAPALAGNAYLVVFGTFDGYAIALAAVTTVMGVLQIALIPYYQRAPFGPAFWVSSFSYATTATLALRWINHELPPGADVWRALALTLGTGVVAALSIGTLRAIARGGFFPRRQQPARGPSGD
jgi:tellurite resistance protein